ncbi:MAG: mechanosensitive ion channel [Lachnospiraceae bacterium]|nr:mechanosensitive ion channel [Lachnospiraceae bacterium]RKI27096.1 mechanosensitive ion channel family protein [bacterium D16-36]RKI69197.1 mechanosensitive ion channel family protein [bacterium 1xD8-6]
MFFCSMIHFSSDQMSVEELTEAMQSSASGEEKTSFLIEYLLSQREGILDFAKTLIFALFVYFIGKKIVKFCLKLTSKWMVKRDVEAGVQNFVMSFAKVGYHLVLIFVVAWILGVGATIIALVGSAGLAVGLALQGSLSNLAGGVLILALKPFRVGEYISVTGVEGTVESIDIFYTRVATTDNKTIVIPNGTITSATITNVTNAEKRMLVLDFMVPYEADIPELKEILKDIMRRDEMIFQDEPMDVVINKLSPLKVQMQLKAWVKTEDYWDVRYRLLEHIKIVLEEKFNIP